MAGVFTMVIAIPFLRLRDGTHPLAAGPVNPGRLHRTGRSGRHAGRCRINLGPGRRIVSRTAREGVSRFAGQAGTQAPDPTPVLSQDRGSRAGSTIPILPADFHSANQPPVSRSDLLVVNDAVALPGTVIMFHHVCDRQPAALPLLTLHHELHGYEHFTTLSACKGVRGVNRNADEQSALLPPLLSRPPR